MSGVPEFLSKPTEAQIEAWRQVNTALASLALAYSIDLDDVNTHVGRYAEEVVSVLLDAGEAA